MCMGSPHLAATLDQSFGFVPCPVSVLLPTQNYFEANPSYHLIHSEMFSYVAVKYRKALFQIKSSTP